MDNNDNIAKDDFLNDKTNVNNNLEVNNGNEIPVMSPVQELDKGSNSLPELIPVDENVNSNNLSESNDMQPVIMNVEPSVAEINPVMNSTNSSVSEITPVIQEVSTVPVQSPMVNTSTNSVESVPTNNLGTPVIQEVSTVPVQNPVVNLSTNSVESVSTNNLGTPVIQEVSTVPVQSPVMNASTNSVESVSTNNLGTPVIQEVSTVPIQSPVMNTSTTSVENMPPNNVVNNDGVSNTNLNNNKVEYKPLSKIKVFGVIFLFVLLIGFVIFLPEITTYVEKFLSGEKEIVYEKITTGKLVCKYETTTTDTTINYEMTYSFSNNKLEKLRYVTVSRVDPSEDSGTMDNLVSKCLLLKQEVESVSGVGVRCEDEPSILTVTQNFDFEKLDKEKLTSAYDEAGGTSPEYEFGQDMDGIEKNMNAIEYTCHREK